MIADDVDTEENDTDENSIERRCNILKKNTILYSLAVVLLSGIGLLEFERDSFGQKNKTIFLMIVILLSASSHHANLGMGRFRNDL